MIPKAKRLVDKNAIEGCRLQWCEVCGERSYGEPHHIFTRGAGGPDHRFNLIQLCWMCHYGKVPSGKLPVKDLLEIVAKREDVPAAELLDSLYAIRRGDS